VPARVSEAFVLRTYPLKEADLVVSFLTRDQGKLRGVAKRARRTKNTFGSGLERLSQVRMAYFQRETRELVNLDSCELIRSQFSLLADYEAGVALDYLAEVTDQLLPLGEPNERFFRLLVAVLEHLRQPCPGGFWRAMTYFSLWAVRLSGYLPELETINRISGDSREVASQILRLPVAEVAPGAWDRHKAADLRRFLVRQMEAHIEKKLVTVPTLEAL
jgi:DNA repair protein RecO (recombination protein O)